MIRIVGAIFLFGFFSASVLWANSQRDYYEVLGVTKTATEAEIRNAYRKLARETHPDLYPGDEEKAKKFIEAADAYEVLSDNAKRSRYDQFGFEGVKSSPRPQYDSMNIWDFIAQVIKQQLFDAEFDLRDAVENTDLYDRVVAKAFRHFMKDGVTEEFYRNALFSNHRSFWSYSWVMFRDGGKVWKFVTAIPVLMILFGKATPGGMNPHLAAALTAGLVGALYVTSYYGMAKPRVRIYSERLAEVLNEQFGMMGKGRVLLHIVAYDVWHRFMGSIFKVHKLSASSLLQKEIEMMFASEGLVSSPVLAEGFILRFLQSPDGVRKKLKPELLSRAMFWIPLFQRVRSQLIRATAWNFQLEARYGEIMQILRRKTGSKPPSDDCAAWVADVPMISRK